MKVFESLNQFEDHTFFGNLRDKLNEAKPEFWKNKDDKDDDKDDDKSDKKDKEPKKMDPEKKIAIKLAEDHAKDAASVIKKVQDNWNRFKTASGDKIENWAQFGNTMKALRTKLGAKGIASYYKLFDSSFIVVLWPKGKKVWLVVIDTKNPNEAVFKTIDKNAVKAFKIFYQDVVKEVIKTKEDYKTSSENRKKEEERSQQKEKLGTFLKQ